MILNKKKKIIIENFSKKLTISKCILINKYKKINSNQLNSLRLLIRNKYIYVYILKNKLLKIIIKNSIYKNILFLLKNTLIYFIFNNFIYSVKIIFNFFKKINKLKIFFSSYIYKKYNLFNLSLISQIFNKKILIANFLNIIKIIFIKFINILNILLNSKKNNNLNNNKMSSNKKNNLLEIISNLSLLDLNDLIKEMENKFNISSLNFIKNNNSKDNNENLKNKNEFSVNLLEVGNNKISVIKIVRTFTGLSLRESKNLVDNVPKLIKENVNKIDAEKIKDDLEKIGAKVELK